MAKACVARLQKEYKALLKEPVPHVTAHPSPANLLEWHFVLEGDADSEFKDGVYHGKITFPQDYPFKPPSISLFTPNGRFATNTKLCLSMTDYHPESWNPMWSVGTILTGLLSFMNDSQPTTGSINTTKAEKQKLAADSLAWNLKNPMFRKLFPEWAEVYEQRQKQEKEQQQQGAGDQQSQQQEPNQGGGAEAQGEGQQHAHDGQQGLGHIPAATDGHHKHPAPAQGVATQGQGSPHRGLGGLGSTTVITAVAAAAVVMFCYGMWSSTTSSSS